VMGMGTVSYNKGVACVHLKAWMWCVVELLPTGCGSERGGGEAVRPPLLLQGGGTRPHCNGEWITWRHACLCDLRLEG
jgi:hypothetical protein